MLRLHIHPVAVAVTAHRMDQFLLGAALSQKLRSLRAVLLRVHLKIDVVQKTCDLPEIAVLPVAQLPGVPAHHLAHGQSVQNVERFLVVLFKKREGFIFFEFRLHFTHSNRDILLIVITDLSRKGKSYSKTYRKYIEEQAVSDTTAHPSSVPPGRPAAGRRPPVHPLYNIEDSPRSAPSPPALQARGECSHAR